MILETIKSCCARSSMSDSQLANERVAQETLESATEQMWRAIAAVNAGSVVVEISTDAFADFLHDWTTDKRTWDERIARARQI